MARRLGAGLMALALLGAAVVLLRGGDEVPDAAPARAAPVDCRDYRPLFFPGLDRGFVLQSLEDVGREADAIVVGAPVREVVHRNAESLAQRRGPVARYVRVRVDRTLWRASDAPELPPVFLANGGSWWYESGEPSTSLFFGRIGQAYLLTLFYNGHVEDTDALGWGYDVELLLPILDGRTPEVVDLEKPFYDAVECKTPDELEALFAAELGRNG